MTPEDLARRAYYDPYPLPPSPPRASGRALTARGYMALALTAIIVGVVAAAVAKGWL